MMKHIGLKLTNSSLLDYYGLHLQAKYIFYKKKKRATDFKKKAEKERGSSKYAQEGIKKFGQKYLILKVI